MDIEFMKDRLIAAALVISAVLCFYLGVTEASLFCLLFAAAGLMNRKEDVR